jgi:uncharacterized protein (DUF1501 family)
MANGLIFIHSSLFTYFMNRRKFLTQTGLFSTAVLFSAGTHGWAVKTQAQTNPLTNNKKRFIVIFLRGAVDGLNVVVPYTETAYYQSRPKIAIPRPSETGSVIDLDGRFGLHPVLAPLMPLWQQGNLAFVHACGSPDPTRSHFEAQNYMETGTPGDHRTHDGWMNRLLFVLAANSPVQALNLGNVTPRILQGSMPVASLPMGQNAARPTPLDRPQIGQAFDRLYSNSNDAIIETYQEARTARQALLKDLKAEMMEADNGAPLPTGFPTDAQRLAQLMARNHDIQLAFLALGGWDTHINQGGSQGQLANRLRFVGQGLANLAQGLGSELQNTTIVVMSEFGRTVRENGNTGTDHGHGNVMWLLGGNLKGGKIYGNWPGLADNQLHQNRDLAITTDFRDVLVTLFERHLQLNDAKLQQVFPNYTPQVTLPFV